AWKKVTVAHMTGPFTVSSTSYALLGSVGKYTTYPTLLFPAGDPDAAATGLRVYLVRSGSTPDVSTCSTALGDPNSQSVPDCMLVIGSSGARTLPDGSTWTILGSLTAATSGPVAPSPGFGPTTFTVSGDNLFGAPVQSWHVPRPTLAVAVTGLPSSIE